MTQEESRLERLVRDNQRMKDALILARESIKSYKLSLTKNKKRTDLLSSVVAKMGYEIMLYDKRLKKLEKDGLHQNM